MNKDTFYFTHDFNARTDVKIKKLIQKHGFLGYGIYWALVEDLYNNANALPTDCEGIAFDMRTHCDIIKSVIHDFDLFIIGKKTFKSLSIEKRLNERKDKSIKATQSANKRWKNANALPSQCDRIAIKERKGKEIKKKGNSFSPSAFSENTHANQNLKPMVI